VSLRARGSIAAGALAAVLLPACGVAHEVRASCTAADPTLTILSAQAVPSATMLPCIKEFPAGWTYEGEDVRSNRATFWLANDRAGFRAVQVDLTGECDVGSAVEVAPAPDEAGTRRFEEPLALSPAYQANRYYRFPGGCVTYRFRFRAGASTTLALEVDEALSFRPRAPLVEHVREEFGQILCGAGAPPCIGE